MQQQLTAFDHNSTRDSNISNAAADTWKQSMDPTEEIITQKLNHSFMCCKRQSNKTGTKLTYRLTEG